MSKLVATVLFLIALTLVVAACGSSTATSADTDSASPSPSSSPSASPSPTPTSWAETFAGKWVDKLDPTRKLVFKNDVAQASVQLKTKGFFSREVFYGDKCRVITSLQLFGPYRREGRGPLPFTGVYAWIAFPNDEGPTQFLTVRFSGTTLTIKYAWNDPLGRASGKEKYTLLEDGESLLCRVWTEGAQPWSAVFVRQ